MCSSILVCLNGFKRPALLAAFFSFIAAASPALGANYDISYLWHPDLASVTAYKDKISGILGPEVTRRLSIVQGQDNYGLIYRRKGGAESARSVAVKHSAFLKAKGLGPAIPIQSKDWTPLKKTAPPAGQAGVLSSGPPAPFESEVEKYIKSLRRRGHIKGDERTAWLIYDLAADKKLVSINEDMPLEAASMIKPFIALAYFHEVNAGRRKYSAAVRSRMERMIQHSDNPSADWLLRRLGGPAKVQRLLKTNYSGILTNTRIVEYISASGRTYRNKASAHDYSRFLYALWNGTLPRSAELKRIMNLPNPDRLYTSSPGVPEGTEVYDKTGTTSHLCGNMGILVAMREDGKRFPYIIVGIIEKERAARNYFGWMRARGDVIRRVSEMAYETISGRHQLEDFSPLSASSGGGKEQADTEESETEDSTS
ncbi:MAG: hypothetical protein AUJ51_02870 [Elusimicrobia bacterium CG1_02_56_21]|nr:MAG: hypothetical protein AUJ51_02870 [Elusimicrobia bacterium CG1_02_56_21]